MSGTNVNALRDAVMVGSPAVERVAKAKMKKKAVKVDRVEPKYPDSKYPPRKK